MKSNALRNTLINARGAGLCLGSFLLLLLAADAHSATLTVGKGKKFDSIQTAIKKAAKGDLIIVSEGIYRESLLIDKGITLRGEGEPVVKGSGTGTVVRITAPRVVFEGFKIQDSGEDLSTKDSGIYIEGSAEEVSVRDNVVENCAFGIWINGAKGVKLTKNHVIGQRRLISPKRGNGIHLWNVRRGLVEGNTVEGARDGIFVDWTEESTFRDNRVYDLRYGFHYMFSHNNRLEGNVTFRNRAGLALMYSNNLFVSSNYSYDNEDHGIMLFTMRNCKVYDNVASNNGKGFFIYDAQYNEIRRNIISGNEIGVHVWAGSVENKVSGNSFLNNRSQIKYVGSKDEEWSDEEKGNYWSDYLGWDTDRNGIGDIPYTANTLMERLIWSYPIIKLLINSPAVQTLRMVEGQFPVLRAPGIVDSFPLMKPLHKDWEKWIGRNSYRDRKTE